MEAKESDKLIYNIIATGSTGNSILIFNSILVDIGIPFCKLKPFIKDIQLVSWSHLHSDHLNKATLKKLLFERPSVRVAICEHEYERAVECGARNIDVLHHGRWYDYGKFQISTFKTFHDVPSNGWRIKNSKHKVFIATDTAFLDGITAPNYSHYLCEANYNADTVFDVIHNLEQQGRYAHQKGAINSHLSEQQAMEFFHRNKGENSELIRLHISESFI